MSHEDVPGIVIEPGTRTTRFGVAGDTSPQIITDSSVLKHESGSIDFDIPLCARPPPTTDVWSPVVDGIVQDFDVSSKHWLYLAEKYLGMQMQEQPLTITEEVWTPVPNKLKYYETVFESIEVPIFQLMKAPLAAAFDQGRTSALVVSVGASSVSAVPVIDGIVRTKSEIHTNFGGDFLDAHVLQQLESCRDQLIPAYMVKAKNHGVDRQIKPADLYPKASESFHNYQLTRLFTDLKRTTCLVNPVPLRGPEIKGTKQYEFPTGYEILLGSERVVISEPLFQPSLFPLKDVTPNSNSLGLSEVIYHALQKADAPPEIMNNLAANIVLHGGTTALPNLPLRVENDLKNLMPNTTTTIHLADSHPVWSGASIFASLGEFHESTWVTKQQYEEQGASYLVENNQ